jgi:hypothetical protein
MLLTLSGIHRTVAVKNYRGFLPTVVPSTAIPTLVVDRTEVGGALRMRAEARRATVWG